MLKGNYFLKPSIFKNIFKLLSARQMVKDDKGMLAFIKSGMYGVKKQKGISAMVTYQ